ASQADAVDVLEQFEAPMSRNSNYGSRVRGFLHPPATGDYVFWIASDDASELLLSSDDDQSKKQRIAQVSLWTAEKNWDAQPGQRSNPIRLEAGRKYYIEVLHKQASAADHLSVAWKFPGENRVVIAGRYLSPFQQANK